MWLFLVTEIMFFGGMFCAYLIYRLASISTTSPRPADSLNIKLGAVNTAVLLLQQLDGRALAVRLLNVGSANCRSYYLIATLFLGWCFSGVKAIEWTEKFEEHHVPTSRVQCHYVEGNLIAGHDEL